MSDHAKVLDAVLDAAEAGSSIRLGMVSEECGNDEFGHLDVFLGHFVIKMNRGSRSSVVIVL